MAHSSSTFTILTILFTPTSAERALLWPRRRNEKDVFSGSWRPAQSYTARGDYFKRDLTMERRRKLSFAPIGYELGQHHMSIWALIEANT